MTADRKTLGRWTLEPAMDVLHGAWVHAGHDASGRPVRVLVFEDSDVTFEKLAAFGAAMEALRKLPGVLPVVEWGADDGVPFIVHEDENVRTLESMLIDGSARGLRISGLAEIARTLEAAHAAGIVHERLSPETVLVDASGRALLWGFRLKMLEFEPDPERDAEPIAKSAIAYMAPEVLKGRPGGPAADAWSLALLVWRVLVGEIPNLRALKPGTPPEIFDVFRFTLQERFVLPPQHALGAELADTLEAVLAAKKPEARGDDAVVRIRKALEKG